MKMKYTLSIVLAAASVVCFALSKDTTKGFSIKGEFDASVEADSVFLYDAKFEKIAAAPVVNGTFELKGSVEEPLMAIVVIMGEEEPENMGKLILDNENYTYSRDGFYEKIKGGKIHDAVLGFQSSDEFIQASQAYDNFLDSISSIDENLTIEKISAEDKARYNALADRVLKIEDNALIPVIDNPATPALVKAYAIERVQNWEKYSVAKRVELLTACREEYGKPHRGLDDLIAHYQSEIEADIVEKTVAGGNSFKEVEAKDIDGNIVKLSEVIAKNKYTILEFWASWCGPCRGEIPNLKKAYEKYKPLGLEIYAVSLDDNREKWLKALKEENAPWLSLLDEKHFEGEAAKGYAIRGIPASFLIDKNGVIVNSNKGLRGEELEKTLSNLFK